MADSALHRITSVHDKEIGEIREFLRKGLLRYWDENKAKEWLTSIGLQPFGPMPGEKSIPSTANILSKGDLVNYKQAARGRITFKPDGTFISLLKDADKSTFLHESAHLYFRVLSDLANAKDASKSIKADLKAVLDWLKVDSVEKMEVKHHEKFARGFEKYLAEGKAPSVELRAAFAQFKAWLIEIYKQLKGLKVNLSDDVRAIMDRMLATKEEIATAEKSDAVTEKANDNPPQSPLEKREVIHLEFKTLRSLIYPPKDVSFLSLKLFKFQFRSGCFKNHMRGVLGA